MKKKVRKERNADSILEFFFFTDVYLKRRKKK